jgi:hypothetical protein
MLTPFYCSRSLDLLAVLFNIGCHVAALSANNNYTAKRTRIKKVAEAKPREIQGKLACTIQ